jgi:hypothetical protein
MKIRLACLGSAATATLLLLVGVSPASAHSYEQCALDCYDNGGTVTACANKCQLKSSHNHTGGGFQPLDNLGFTSNGRPDYSQFHSRYLKSYNRKSYDRRRHR